MPDLPCDPHVQLLVLERIDDAQNMARYYVLSVEPTLFEEFSLVREWGRLGARGRRRIELHANAGAARLALDVWFARKTKRGYKRRQDASAMPLRPCG
jgi:predicted DNA-binding WGR domain protein